MSPEDIKFVQEYYRNTEHRDPTLTELKVIDTYWSDHCRHTTFNTTLENISFDDTPYGQIVREAFAEYMTMQKRRVRRTGQEPVPHGYGMHRSKISQETRQG